MDANWLARTWIILDVYPDVVFLVVYVQWVTFVIQQENVYDHQCAVIIFLNITSFIRLIFHLNFENKIYIILQVANYAQDQTKFIRCVVMMDANEGAIDWMWVAVIVDAAFQDVFVLMGMWKILLGFALLFLNAVSLIFFLIKYKDIDKWTLIGGNL